MFRHSVDVQGLHVGRPLARDVSACASFRLHDVQVERNLQDAMGVARNVCFDPRLVPGGGAVEMAVSRGLADKSAKIQVPFLSDVWAVKADHEHQRTAELCVFIAEVLTSFKG